MDIVLVPLLILVTLSKTSGWRPFTVEFQNISYELFHPEIFILNVTTKNQIFNISFNVLKDIPRPYVDFQLLHDSGNGKFDMVYSNKTVDVCMFLNNRKSNPVFNILLNLLSEYGEFPKKCPIIKKQYTFVNFTIDPEKFPPFMPDHRAHASGVIWNKENGQKLILLKRPFTVEFQNISYLLFHPQIIGLHVTTRNKTFDISFNILRDIPWLSVDFELLHDSGNGKFDMVYTNRTIDLCMFLNNRKSNPVFNIVYNSASKYVQLPRRCPLIRKRYSIENFAIDPEQFPPFMPDHRAHASGLLWIKENGKKKIILKGSVNVILERAYKNN